MSLPCAVDRDFNKWSREQEIADSNAELLESIRDEAQKIIEAVDNQYLTIFDTLKKVKASVEEINTTIELLEGK